MKAILIDPFDQSVSEVDYNGDYKEIHNLCNCSTFDVVQLRDGENDIYVDDEGLLKTNRYFRYVDGDYTHTLAGKSLILAHDDEGSSVDTTLNAADVAWVVEFLPEGHIEEPMMEFFMTKEPEDLTPYD